MSSMNISAWITQTWRSAINDDMLKVLSFQTVRLIDIESKTNDNWTRSGFAILIRLPYSYIFQGGHPQHLRSAYN